MALTWIFYKHIGFKGERYFKVLPGIGKVVQVCVSPGEMKQGRSNTVGIYLINYMTVQSNYAFSSHFQEATEQEYQEAFDKVFEKISQ